MPSDNQVLRAPHIVEYTYTRSVGPALERFFTGLAEHRIEGVRISDGRVMVPPTEYDPVTSDDVDEWVTVADTGVVTTWAWVNQPLEAMPFDRPFAYALVKLDGADTAMLHAVDTDGAESKMSTGMKVKARWRADAIADITAIECFEPAGAS